MKEDVGGKIQISFRHTLYENALDAELRLKTDNKDEFRSRGMDANQYVL